MIFKANTNFKNDNEKFKLFNNHLFTLLTNLYCKTIIIIL